MKVKIPPSEALRQEISKLMREGLEMVCHPLDSIVHLSARFILQVALEREVLEFLGREYYQRTTRRRGGWRNGYEPRRLKTTQGIVPLLVPQLRNTQEGFQSKLLKAVDNSSVELQQMVTQMYLRGLSTRDVEKVFQEVFGDTVISKSGVSHLSQTLWEEFDQWRKRDLSVLRLVYLFLDATYVPARQGSGEKEGLLCAYGLTEEGHMVFIHLALGSRESYDSWISFLHDMTARGLNEPLLIISDGQPGLRKAIREVFPRSLKQRCQVHKMRNILCKLPKGAVREIKGLVQQVFLAPDYTTAQRRARSLISRFKARYTSAMECLEEGLEECIVYLKFPREHHRRIRTTNLLERTFGEGKRRTKVIPRFPTEGSCLKLFYATLVTASRGWHGVKMTPKILRELEHIRTEMHPLRAVA